ncbi:MAG TPA: amidohydrolase family protein [Candidatus Nitrosotalea sp.]|nr:amidohydrolase family protein [Candidatus Nitrosotalea sp.]
MSEGLGHVAQLALTGATLYASPDAQPLHDAIVVVRDGTIAEVRSGDSGRIPPGVARLDCSGCTIVAGLWNSHVHFHERKWAGAEIIPAAELARQLREFARYGFTSVFDLSSQLRNTRRIGERIESGEIAGPRIRSTGEGLIPAGGAPPAEVFRALGLMETALAEVSDADQARSAAARLLDAGVDGIKLFISGQSGASLSAEAIRAAAETAHESGKPVFAHPNTAADILAALDGCVDIIGHTTPRSGPWEPQLIEAMLARGAALIPTLMVWKSLLRHDRISTQERAVATAVEQLRAWLECGGTLLFGTDLGAVEYDPREEYALMAEAGATFRTVLASLTTLPAQLFMGSKRFGEVAVGNPADLVVLEADPAQSIEAFASARCTLRAGEILHAP